MLPVERGLEIVMSTAAAKARPDWMPPEEKVGAGSVVTRDIPDGVLAAGNPCRVIREITE